MTYILYHIGQFDIFTTRLYRFRQHWSDMRLVLEKQTSSFRLDGVALVAVVLAFIGQSLSISGQYK